MAKDFRHVKTTSFIGPETELEGDLVVKGGLRIDGKLNGTLTSNSVVYLGDRAEVEADVEAAAVISSGHITGGVRAAQLVQIALPGSMRGAVETRELTLEKGVYFDGSCKIIQSER